ncbi:hypothetical protein [Rhodococcus jostii]|uniref:hypothetical protein n=1 Tax=Rhodococcus jostii TaxID=132919 RepID=UPI00365C4C37
MSGLELPEGFKLTVGFTTRINGVLTGQVHLMRPRKRWGGYAKVATTTTCEGGGDTDQSIIGRLLASYYRESDWL